MTQVINMKILFIGDMTAGHCANSLVEGFKELGVDMRIVDTSSYMRRQSIGSREWFQRRFAHKPSQEWIELFKLKISEVIFNWKPVIVFCINTIHIPQEILQNISCKIKVHLSYDDVSNGDNLTDDYLKHECGWDVIFTNKIYNVEELETRSTSQIVYFENAYNPKLHRLYKPLANRKFDIGFIGARRIDRNKLPIILGEAHNLNAVVAGPRWRRSYPFGVRGVTLLPEVLNEDYMIVGNDVKVGLCLLNSANRDQITTRSFELPAFGQVIVGQKSMQHEDLLENGKEAFWFDTVPEMVEFSSKLLFDTAKCERVAISGYRRITGGKNTYADRAIMMLHHLK